MTTFSYKQIRTTFALVAIVLHAGCVAWTPTPTVPGSNTTPKTAPAMPSSTQRPIIRGQQPSGPGGFTPVDDYSSKPMPVSTATTLPPPVNEQNQVQDRNTQPAQYTPNYGIAPPESEFIPPPQGQFPPPATGNPSPYVLPPGPNSPANSGNYSVGPTGPGLTPGNPGPMGSQPYSGQFADLIVNVKEQQTGRFMFGVGMNSDAGLTAQVILDEYNFDWRRFPRGIDDIIDGGAWRGGGQRLRIEAIPGSQLQRYMVNFTEPYLLDTNVSLNLSGFLYDRRYLDWDEQRLGGRVGLGYRLTPDLSIRSSLRLENVNVSDPRTNTVPQLNEVIGDNSLYSGGITLSHDTRDSAFAPTEGHLLELTFEQAFCSYTYPRGVVDYRRYFLLKERPDGSGRHVLGTSLRTGISGTDTPLYENFFAGGYSTLRGFRFRSATPQVNGVYVGGELSLLGSTEYTFPITADDMLKGVVFCDFGTIEEELEIEWDDFRVAVGTGLRVSIPAMGPAPIALDLAVPIAREQTDRIQNFSFFVGFGR